MRLNNYFLLNFPLLNDDCSRRFFNLFFIRIIRIALVGYFVFFGAGIGLNWFVGDLLIFWVFGLFELNFLIGGIVESIVDVSEIDRSFMN